MSSYARIADLPVRIDGYRLEALSQEVGGGAFTRVTTVIRLEGGGEEGIGEDVCYDPEDHYGAQAAGPTLPLAGEFTIESFSRHVEALDLFPTPSHYPEGLLYRRWAYESAALDLGLRQAGTSLAEALGLTPRPVSFVVSMRLPEPADPEPVRRLLARDPSLRFKLDPTPAWTPGLVEDLHATGAVATVDLKGLYSGTPVDLDADPALYSLVASQLPEAWIEDPRLTPETLEALAGHEGRVTWDAPIHTLADILALPWTPRTINVKPSRIGTLRDLLEIHDHLRERGIGAYGGGQFELGPGRGQIQYLASLFHPDMPNDVAPTGYNLDVKPPGLPGNPLPVAASPIGFRWGE